MRPSVGMWIWDVARCEGGDIRRIVEKARLYRLGHVLIKTNDGTRSYNGTLGPLVRALKDAGVHIWSWAYVYPRNATEAAEAFASRSLALGVNGVCVDAEAEFKGRPDAAVAYMETLREMVGRLPIMLSSFYRPAYHQTFPWEEFLSRSDFGNPQVYWFKRNPEEALRAALAEWASYISRSRLIPAGAAYLEGCGDPANIGRFLAECEAQDVSQVNFWSWQHATEAMWTEIGGVAAV